MLPSSSESALRGKVLVQLSSGTPDEAREMESWARPRGIDYLDGAIMNYPVARFCIQAQRSSSIA